MAKHIRHKKSKVVVNNTNPKLPSASDIDYGEIAINYATDHETISMKNEDNEVVTFSSDKFYNNKERIISTALNDLDDRTMRLESNFSEVVYDSVNKRFVKTYIDGTTSSSIVTAEQIVADGGASSDTITSIIMNDSAVQVSNHVANLGTVITQHQDISGKADKATTYTISETDALLEEMGEVTASSLVDLNNTKADKETTYTKTEVDAKIVNNESVFSEIAAAPSGYVVGQLRNNIENTSYSNSTFYNQNLASGTYTSVVTAAQIVEDSGVKTTVANLTEITYADLVTLKTQGKLIEGMQYKITDYRATTSESNTIVNEPHDFDIIVTATSGNTLSENAKAAQHSDVSYFNDSKLNAWELKYSLDNDQSRFAWANTTEGKGVIYYMKDEFGNECPYDFKNIKFNVTLEGTNYDVYTFNQYVNGMNADATRQLFVCGNKIEPYYSKESGSTIKQYLNRIYFMNKGITGFPEWCGNVFGVNCNNVVFNDQYLKDIIVEGGNQYITLQHKSGDTAPTSATPIRNITITQGVNNTTTNKDIEVSSSLYDANYQSNPHQITYRQTNSVEILVS